MVQLGNKSSWCFPTALEKSHVISGKVTVNCPRPGVAGPHRGCGPQDPHTMMAFIITGGHGHRVNSEASLGRISG